MPEMMHVDSEGMHLMYKPDPLLALCAFDYCLIRAVDPQFEFADKQ